MGPSPYGLAGMTTLHHFFREANTLYGCIQKLARLLHSASLVPRPIPSFSMALGTRLPFSSSNIMCINMCYLYYLIQYTSLNGNLVRILQCMHNMHMRLRRWAQLLHGQHVLRLMSARFSPIQLFNAARFEKIGYIAWLSVIVWYQGSWSTVLL